MPLKIIIAGSRDFDKPARMAQFVDRLIAAYNPQDGVEIVSGKARGADTLGEQYAQARGYPVVEFPADWEQHGRAAGPIRNQQMADYADVLIAFPLKESVGTLDMILKAIQANLDVHVRAAPDG